MEFRSTSRKLSTSFPDKLQTEKLKSGNPEFPRAPPEFGIQFPYPVGQEGKHFQIFQEYTNLLADKDPETRDEVTTDGENFHFVLDNVNLS